jgi:predicted ATPase
VNLGFQPIRKICMSTLKAPLSRSEIRSLVQTRLATDDLPERLSRLLVDKAEGNPLFAEEIVSFLTERGMLRVSGGTLEFDPDAVGAALPASVQGLLSARVDRLAPKDSALLQAASVIGRHFDPELLAVVTGETDVNVRLAAIHALDLVRFDGKSGDYAFKHALVRDALYQSLLTDPRKALHLKIGEEIERRRGNRLWRSSRGAGSSLQPDRSRRQSLCLSLYGRQ